jgi:magnesium-transporting ATPase (P-type)
MQLPLPLLLNFVGELISQDNIITFGAVGLIFYIAALVLSKTTKCIIIWHWWDLIILAIPGIIFLGSFYFYYNNKNESIDFINNIAINILFVFSFTATILLSVVANIKYSGILKSVIFIIIAVFVKIFIAILIPIFIVLFLGAINSGKKDKRYKYGTKGNQNIITAGIIAALAALLIGVLIKNGDDEE